MTHEELKHEIVVMAIMAALARQEGTALTQRPDIPSVDDGLLYEDYWTAFWHVAPKSMLMKEAVKAMMEVLVEEEMVPEDQAFIDDGNGGPRDFGFLTVGDMKADVEDPVPSTH